MSLSVALNTAQSSLFAAASKLSVSSRNIGAANDPSATRKIALTATTADGGTRVVSITRASNNALYVRMLQANSDSAASSAMNDGLAGLQTTIGDPQSQTSPAARLATLSNALTAAANTPDDPALGQAAVTAAQDLAQSLNDASAIVQKTRAEADGKIAASVTHVNDLLQQFATENDAVVNGSIRGADVTDAMDRRDAILTQISQEMGVSTVSRAGNDIVIYTDSGATLFDRSPRTVTFQASPALDAATTGKAVFVDGVAVTGADATMPIRSGAIAGLTKVRDQIAVTYQTQLDEVARGLVSAFAESDQTGGGAPDAAGLFTASRGSNAVPPVFVAGLAGTIAINAAVDPSRGGAPSRLRDGGMNGAAYIYNPTGAASYAGHLDGLTAALNATQPFAAGAALPGNASVSQFATASVSWLEQQRQSTTGNLDSQKAVLSQATGALSSATGINLDQEYANQLDLERSYQASAKLMGVVNQLYDALLAVIR